MSEKDEIKTVPCPLCRHPITQYPAVIEKHYSGDLSKDFWKRVNAVNEPDKTALYSLGVALQNLEEQVAKELHNAEVEKAFPNRFKASMGA